MLLIEDVEAWNVRIREILSRYDEALLRQTAGGLFKIKIGQHADDLIEKSVETQTNAPVIDRRIRDLPVVPRKLLSLIGMSRQPTWTVGHLIHLVTAIGPADGLIPIETLLQSGLLFPDLKPTESISNFLEWIGQSADWSARVVVHPAAAARARAETAIELNRPQLEESSSIQRSARMADGLDWPLRLWATWQQIRRSPVRLTQSNQLFKRDQTRLQADPVLNTPLVDVSIVPVEAAILAFEWAACANLLTAVDEERHADDRIPTSTVDLRSTLVELIAAFFHVRGWDPLSGMLPAEAPLSSTPTAALLILSYLSSIANTESSQRNAVQKPNTASKPVEKAKSWCSVQEITQWLWEHHSAWAGSLPRESQKSLGKEWVESFLLTIAYPLCLVEWNDADGHQFRLSDFGRYCFLNDAQPPPTPGYPQTLLVQPNAEVLVYRQGLTPRLIASLSQFATWKRIGPACTLELNAEEMNFGLQAVASIQDHFAVLERHGMRPIPANVADLMRRWANKRERITLYPSATLVEFSSAADLDAAIARGIVSTRITDRIGVTVDGTDPNFSQLRLISNRDYDSTPQQCVTVGPDGISLSVDAAASDLLLDAEMLNIAEPRPSADSHFRRYQITPESIRKAIQDGTQLEELDRWFMARSGSPLPPAARLLIADNDTLSAVLSRRLVLRVASEELADGLMQWPATAAYIHDRLGPTSLVIEENHVAPFMEVLNGIGIRMEQR